MNIHPLLVHFPIALLTLYSMMEIGRFPAFTRQPYWFFTKAILCIVGSFSGILTIISGKMIVDQFLGGSRDKLINAHENFAILSICVFLILAISYLILWWNRSREARLTGQQQPRNGLWNVLLRVARFVVETPLSILLAIIGFIALTITGALGGATVYGPDIDPVVRLVYGIVIGQ